ncbi:hypothetical protein IID24_04670 [Patescibacteria group bacterium]|nr:hypothetical protein [Patescibacteria group bacterium]
MRDTSKVLITAIQHSLRDTGYKFLFVGVALAMFSLYIYIPVFIVAGNDLAFQLSLFTPQDAILLGFLSLLNALFITMQVYAIRMTRSAVSSISKSISGSFGALFAGIAGSAFCASCLVPLFAFFGIGFSGVIVTLQYRFYFVAVIVALMLIAIYLTSKKIVDGCEDCK